jgi:hypothetical protein
MRALVRGRENSVMPSEDEAFVICDRQILRNLLSGRYVGTFLTVISVYVFSNLCLRTYE